MKAVREALIRLNARVIYDEGETIRFLSDDGSKEYGINGISHGVICYFQADGDSVERWTRNVDEVVRWIEGVM